MAKRNQAKIASKSRKSALRVEALEQRQLLATVTGAGTQFENLSNPLNPGILYDQVLMTGSSVTVTADAGQITRVSFLDMQGDIVQAEFSGSGTMTVSLTNPNNPTGAIGAAATPANYNQPGVQYVQGLATFTIQGSNADTNFAVFSVGSSNAVNQGLFEGGKTGGDNNADVKSLLIVANPTNPGGFSTFGSIFAGNAEFVGDSGTVGIAANNVNVQGTVRIGDIDATNSGVPTLNFGSGSQFSTVQVAGGDLVQTNSATIQGTGFKNVNSIDGTSSAGVTQTSKVVTASSFADIDPNTVGAQLPTVVTLDNITAFDLTGKTQSEIQAAFKDRTFSKSITISGDLAAVNQIEAAEFRGDVTFTGAVAGDITVTNSILGKLSFAKSVDGASVIKASSIGSIETTAAANLGGSVTAKSIGNIIVDGNLSAAIATDYYKTGDTVPNQTAAGVTAAFDTGEGKVGNVSVKGNLSGTILGVLGIGNVSVGGNVTSNPDGAGRPGVFATASGNAGDAAVANIGTIAITGDVNLDDITDNFISISGTGTFGDVTVTGKGTVSSSGSDVNDFGAIVVSNAALGTGAKLGAINITDDARGIAVGTITVSSGVTGSFGGVTVDATQGVNGTNVTLGEISADTDITVGNISVKGAETITIGNISGRAIGNVSATAVAIDSPVVTIGAIKAGNVGGDSDIVGNISVDATTIGKAILGGAISAGNGSTKIGDVTVSGKTVTISGSLSAPTIGNVALTAVDTGAKAVDFTGSITAGTLLTSLTVNGHSTWDGSNITVEDTGALTFNGNTVLAKATIVGNDGGSSIDAIGAITFNGRVSGDATYATAADAEIRGSSIASITVNGALSQNQSLVTDLNVVARNNGNGTSSNAETVARDGSNLASYGIGNITVQSTNTIGVATTSLFKGNNTFSAIGKIGNISLLAGGSPAVQTTLFSATTDTASFNVGDWDGLIDANAGMDFDGNGAIDFAADTTAAPVGISHDTNITEADEDNAVFSSATTVSVGNISIVAAPDAAQLNTVTGVGGTAALNGLIVLAAVKAGADTSPDGLVRSSTTLNATVGDISVSNLSQVLSNFQGEGLATSTDDVGIIAAGTGNQTTSNFGAINGVSTGGGAGNMDLTAMGNSVIVGEDPDGQDDTEGDANEIVVIRL